jgi:hypothetical protein
LPTVTPNAIPSASNPQIDKPRELQWQEAIAAKNVPVNFYGIVVDQESQPIPGVQVKMNVRHSEYFPSQGIASTYPKAQTVTDSGGHFSWTGETGDALTIETVSKTGYVISPKFPRNFSPPSNGPESPVIIRMWKERAKESLISGSHVFGIIPDGRPYTLDLLLGKKLEGATEGDLRISMARPSGVEQKDKFQWTFSMEAIDGGLVQTNDEFMYLAPDSGYESKFEVQLNPAEPTWTQFLKKSFFVRSRNGKVHGRIELQADAIFNDHSAVEINYTVNPGGSRNLQP